MSKVGLIADIGGTNARFTMCDGVGRYGGVVAVKCADFDGPAAAAAHCLDRMGPAVHPRIGAFCVAGPVGGDRVALTNHPWQFSIRQTQHDLGLERLTVVNDFSAVALALPHLTKTDIVQIDDGAPVPGAPMAVLGAGTGLGVSGLVFATDGSAMPLNTEGGHVSLAAQDETDVAIIEFLRQRFGHVSAERAVSGPGLVKLYEALCALEGIGAEQRTPAEITAQSEAGDPISRRAVERFCRFLGSVAGDLALTLGARGGVYIGGGIAPRMVATIKASGFRKSFIAKGRFEPHLTQIPTYIITHDHPAFIGLSTLVGSGV